MVIGFEKQTSKQIPGYPKFKQMVCEKHLSSDIAKELRTSETRLWAILNGEGSDDFDGDEVIIICKLLNKNATEIFRT